MMVNLINLDGTDELFNFSLVLLIHLLGILEGLKNDMPKDEIVQNAFSDFTAEIEKRLGNFDRQMSRTSKSSKSSNSFRKR